MVLQGNLRRAQMIEEELRQQLRFASVHRYEDVAAVILERTGAISVLRQGETIAPDMLADVIGGELLAPHAIDRDRSADPG